MNAKLKDIAKKAGVSVSTVSRVINSDPVKPASPETVEKVWKIVHEMQYVPNQTARMLIHRAKNGSEELDRKSIGCILASSDDLFIDPFFSEVIAGIYQETIAQGYAMEYTFPISSKSSPQDAAFFNSLVTRSVNGAILLGRMNQETLDMLRTHIPHLVYCGLNYIDGDISQVLCDAVQGISLAVDHLVQLGHKRIGFIGETNRDQALLNEHRFSAFQQTMLKHNLPVEECYVVESALSLNGGYESMSRALSQGKHASAYFCVNDITAIGVMRAIQERGLCIPQDISLIGFDDIELCSFVSPKLTSIHTHKKAMGTMAVRMLMDQIQNDTIPVRTYMPFKLIERESCMISGSR